MKNLRSQACAEPLAYMVTVVQLSALITFPHIINLYSSGLPCKYMKYITPPHSPTVLKGLNPENVRTYKTFSTSETCMLKDNNFAPPLIFSL